MGLASDALRHRLGGDVLGHSAHGRVLNVNNHNGERTAKATRIRIRITVAVFAARHLRTHTALAISDPGKWPANKFAIGRVVLNRLSTILSEATIGTASTMPTIPHKSPQNASDRRTVTGCSSSPRPIIRGATTLPSTI